MDPELGAVTYKDVPWFNLDGVYEAKCVKVYDGDTATFAFRTRPGEPITKHRCRLHGIDSPEVRGVPDLEPGRAAAEFLRRLVGDRVVRLSVSGTEKYGRLLVRITVDGKDVAKRMIEAGHAIPYDGTGPKASDIQRRKDEE